VSGYPDGTFRPDATLTRAEVCVIVANAINRNADTLKGLAWTYPKYPEDYDRLGASWQYSWGAGQSGGEGNVPMAYSGTLPEWFPADYDGWLLVFNEPNNRTPYGADIDPVPAAGLYKALRNDYPQAKMVVGGISAWCDVAGFGPSRDWVVPFLNELDSLGVPLPEYWHIHGYVESWITADIIIEWWKKHRQLTGAKYWVTEFAAPDGTKEDVVKLIEFMQSVSWIERYGYFSTRLEGTEAWCPPGWEQTVPAVDWDTGDLTAIGKYLATL